MVLRLFGVRLAKVYALKSLIAVGLVKRHVDVLATLEALVSGSPLSLLEHLGLVPLELKLLRRGDHDFPGRNWSRFCRGRKVFSSNNRRVVLLLVNSSRHFWLIVRRRRNAAHVCFRLRNLRRIEIL